MLLMKLTILFIYGFVFAVSFFLLALLWHAQMSDVYFVCKDRGPIADFVPPFVHENAAGNFFIKPPRVVYTIWGVYAGAALLIPAVISWLLVRMYEHALKKSWM